MTPTLTSFTIPSSLTGYSGDQTIQPNKLTAWRIMNINEDGTIEMISANTSNEDIYFYGKTGYKNYIGVLNDIASAYENSTYTIGSRNPGYYGQIQFLNDNSLANSTDQNTQDVASLRNMMPDNNKDIEYWIAFREYTSVPQMLSVYIMESSVCTTYDLVNPSTSYTLYKRVRPIVILKSGLKTSEGNGTSTSHWKLA